MDPTNDSKSGRMPVWQHLDELRQRLLWSLAAVVAGVCVTYFFLEKLIWILEKPLLDILPAHRQYLYFTGLTDKFVVYFQVCILAGCFLVSPFLFYQLWRFVAPGLREKERKFVVPFVLGATFAFALGVAFAYFLILPYGYKFLIEFGSPTDQAMITLKEYFSLTLKLLLAVGCIFETPVLFILLGKFGLVTASQLKAHRRLAFLTAAVVAAIATPTPDAFTMCLVLVPLYLLYEVSIVTVSWMEKHTRSRNFHVL